MEIFDFTDLRDERVLLICEPASHASHDASHASHASHGFNVRKNMRAMRAKVRILNDT